LTVCSYGISYVISLFVGLEFSQVNRNPISDEMQRMRQQIEYLQAELVSARGGTRHDELQVRQQKIRHKCFHFLAEPTVSIHSCRKFYSIAIGDYY
jgi:hypothetical protein